MKKKERYIPSDLKTKVKIQLSDFGEKVSRGLSNETLGVLNREMTYRDAQKEMMKIGSGSWPLLKLEILKKK